MTALHLVATSKPARAPSLYNQLARCRARDLPDVDLLAALLGGGTRRRRALADRLLAEAGSVWGMGRLGLRCLREMGVSAAQAARLAACFELGRRAGAEPVWPDSVREPHDAYRCVAPHFTSLDRERFVVVVLDAKSRPRHVAIAAEGSIDACPVDAREVFAPAMRERGSAVLVAHNHPSGDLTPSPEDVALTDRLVAAGMLLGIPLVDHILIGAVTPAPRWMSFAERGLMAAPVRRAKRSRGA